MKSPSVFSAAVILLSFLLPLTPGCGGGKGGSGGQGSMPEPTWLSVDSSKFLPLEGLDTDVDRDKSGTARIRAYDPKGWKRLHHSGEADRRGEYLIGFTSKQGHLKLWGLDSKLDYLTETDLSEVALSIQEKFKVPVRMVKLGDIYGVAFNSRSADPKRPGYFFPKAVVMTVLNHRMYTFEGFSREETIPPELRYALYTFVASTKMLKLDGDGELVEYSVPTVARESLVASAAPVELAATTEVDKPDTSADESATVAVTPESKSRPEAKPEPAAKSAAPAKSRATKNILDELDDLLN